MLFEIGTNGITGFTKYVILYNKSYRFYMPTRINCITVPRVPNQIWPSRYKLSNKFLQKIMKNLYEFLKLVSFHRLRNIISIMKK